MISKRRHYLIHLLLIKYIKGTRNHANTISRYPVGEPDKDDIAASDMVNTFVQRMAAVTAEKNIVSDT